jgi:hypothetical protein
VQWLVSIGSCGDAECSAAARQCMSVRDRGIAYIYEEGGISQAVDGWLKPRVAR